MNWHVPSRNYITEWYLLGLGFFFLKMYLNFKDKPRKRMTWKLESQTNKAKSRLWNEAFHFYACLPHSNQRSIFNSVLKNEVF